MPEKWNVGLIVGKSGTGKTTIAKEIFKKDYIDNIEYDNEKSIIDNFPMNCSFEQITNTLCAVGLSSPPLWLKRYNVLSNGEKMRCDLARCLLQKKDKIVFDEFTSVVDRQVAQVCSFAMQKLIRKQNKQFIAVTCHYDVQDFLMPDWIFNTDNMTFQILNFEEQKKNRPKFNLSIYAIDKNKRDYYWRFFKKYHYLNSELNKNAICFVCYCNNNLRGFASAIKFPAAKCKYIIRGHRIVVFPDYQCVGIGGAMQTFVYNYLFKIYQKKINLSSSNPNFVKYMMKNKHYKLTSKGINNKPHSTASIKCFSKRYKYNFTFIPDAD